MAESEHPQGQDPEQSVRPGEVDKARSTVLTLLGASPVAVDELIRQCHMSAPVALAVLLELELAGRLDRHPGNQVSLRYSGSL